MTSYIVDYIKENNITKEDLVEKFLELGINVNIIDNLALFKYRIDVDFSNPIVQEARGIIIDMDTLEVVCWPFRKFGNYNESYADEIDWSSAQVQEKIDGSIIKLWYYKGVWNWSTNGNIYAKTAKVNNGMNHSFLYIIHKAENYNKINYDELNIDYTYIFELVSPENPIVVKYDKNMLYHLGTRNNKTGEEYSIDIGIEKPKVYNISSFDECLEAAKILNSKVNVIENEGFVVVDKNWNRIKIKSPTYVALHHVINNYSFSKKRCLKLLRECPEDISTLLKDYPHFEYIFTYYKYKIEELYVNVDTFIKITNNLYDEYQDRRIVWEKLKNHPYVNFGMTSLKGYTAKEQLDRLPFYELEKFIDDYVPRDIYKELNL